ncbi:MAG TPA: PP2C family protein-serine/threonine phosphatase [Solirubrobacteraceae bacterium]|nr:PP2C family protein-serine/threonine phosphatase [Solirubrobacteraceae bacterium]
MPIVTTITRIVGVVPTLLWVAIVALAALVLGLAVRTRLAALRAGRLERQRRELLADVGLLQAALLPAPPGRLGPVGTSVAYRPADGPGAGGDFYDVFGLGNGSLGVIVGDVSGHGRSALPHTALVRYTLRAYLEAWLSPREAVQTAGSVLDRQLGGSFVTVVAAVYHPRERTLTYASAGHPPPIVLGAECLQPVTAAAAPPLGTGMRTGTRQTVVSVPGGAQLCFYTDGVTEARVGGGELYGSDRLTAALGGLGARATAVALLDRVAAETRLRPDDMAACLLSVAGEACAPRALVEEIELDRETAAGERTERFLFACGVLPEEVASLTRAAAALTQRSGSVLLDVRFDAGATPQVALRHDNLAPLHRRPSVARPARAGVS